MVDWSYELLSDEERALLCTLSIFAGDCSLEAAEVVCAAPPINRNRVLDVLGELTSKSLNS